MRERKNDCQLKETKEMKGRKLVSRKKNDKERMSISQI